MFIWIMKLTQWSRGNTLTEEGAAIGTVHVISSWP